MLAWDDVVAKAVRSEAHADHLGLFVDELPRDPTSPSNAGCREFLGRWSPIGRSAASSAASTTHGSKSGISAAGPSIGC
jgi:hypothetical protein